MKLKYKTLTNILKYLTIFTRNEFGVVINTIMRLHCFLIIIYVMKFVAFIEGNYFFINVIGILWIFQPLLNQLYYDIRWKYEQSDDKGDLDD